MVGADWQRQRKCTAASFNEQSNALVWSESLRQGDQLLKYWKSDDVSLPSTMAQDTRTLTLDVLVHVAFGMSFDFRGAREKQPNAGHLSYRDALAMILQNMIVILALGPETLKYVSFIPGLGRLSEATNQFSRYLSEMFDEHSKTVQAQSRGNLISSLVRASVKDKIISREEVIGNLFVFNFAGHDTTSYTFTFNFMLLALHPEVQDWIYDEINHVVRPDEKTADVDYNRFPRLVRTLAVLVRLLPIAMHRIMLLTSHSSRLCDFTIRSSASSKEQKANRHHSP